MPKVNLLFAQLRNIAKSSDHIATLSLTRIPMKTAHSLPHNSGIMVCGHGSRDNDGVNEFTTMVAGLRTLFPESVVESGFLEFARPTIGEGLEALQSRGVRHILAVPAMLFAAGHVKNDIPSELNSFAATHPDITIQFGRELAIDPRMINAAAKRIEEAEKTASSQIPRSDSVLMLVGRGTNDPDANANIAKISRLLAEGLGYGWNETCFSGTAYPRVDEGLEIAHRLGFGRIVVFPYFLFTGVLVKRIYQQTDLVAARHPETQFLKASYFNDHPLVIETLADRARDILSGDNAMNCMLCKYRSQIIGYAGDQGQPQVGHHHHVRGIGTQSDSTDDSTDPQAVAHHHTDSPTSDHHHGHHSTHHHARPTPGGKTALP